MDTIDRTKICCIGAGYVGGPTMATIAHKCPHVQVNVVDLSEDRIAQWNSDELPIFEPGLREVVLECRGRNLFFSTAVGEAIRDCDIIFVSVNTPTKREGVGAGFAADLCTWELAGRTIAKHALKPKIVIEKSTVPVRTAQALQEVLDAEAGPGRFVILSNPEFLAEGTAMSDLAKPDRVLVGGPTTSEGREALNILKDIYACWVPQERILLSNVWSSELSKLVANAFLAQRVSSINSIAQLCEKTGADVSEVAHAIGLDSRIGPKFLQASVGFGGSCFQKDILNLVYLCRTYNLDKVADYWEQVVQMNEHQKETFASNIVKSMFNTVRGKKIAIFGFAFKKDTSDTRETPALTVCKMLLQEGAVLHVYDPKVSRAQCLQEFNDHQHHDLKFEKLVTCKSAEEAATGAHAIVILTEWDEFTTLPYDSYYGNMMKPAFIFDGRNLLHKQHAELSTVGFRVHAIGKGRLEA